MKRDAFMRSLFLFYGKISFSKYKEMVKRYEEEIALNRKYYVSIFIWL